MRRGKPIHHAELINDSDFDASAEFDHLLALHEAMDRLAEAQANVSGGVTTPVSLTVPGNTPDGTYTIQAVYSDATNNFVAASPSTTTLTIFPWT
jgi:hypothetical protein